VARGPNPSLLSDGRVRVVLASSTLIRGGVSRHIEDLAVCLSGQGHDVLIALPDAAEAPRASARALDLHVIGLRQAIRRADAIVHFHLHDTFDRGLAAAVVARRLIGPTVITEHLPRSNASDESLLPGPRAPLARSAKTAFKRVQYACADAVIAVSPSSAEFLASRYGVARDRIDVVMNGVRTFPGTVARQADGDSAAVVSVGSVIHQKGHDVLLAAAAAAHGTWTATVIGDGPRREPLALNAQSAALPVEFTNWTDDVGHALAQAQLACFPSRWESCPYAVIEAMGAGLPIVGSDVDGIRDLVDDGVTGLLVAPDNPHALAAALGALSRDHETRRRMGEAARKAAAKFTAQRMCAETLGVYVCALSRRRGADRTSGDHARP
jgi:glycosyltransferase involved in cell wall biosynthesis